MNANMSAFENIACRFRKATHSPLFDAAMLGFIVLAVSLSGTLVRQQGHLSAFWIANAVLLGLMLRRPAFATLAGWISAITGFLLADFLAGSSWTKNILLAAGNMTGIASGYLVATRINREDLRLRRPASALCLVLVTGTASAAAGLAGAVINPILFGTGTLEGFFYWIVTEFANYIAILPVMLTATLSRPRLDWLLRAPAALSDWRKTMPVLVTIAGLALEPLVGGPGALVFAVPGLLWCAIAYDVAVTALLVFLFAMWTLITITMNFVRLGIPLNTEFDLISLRLGVTLVALGPITVATVMTARNALLREMAAARAAAEDAMASRSLLLATMTHELRSPLAAMIGLAEVMAKQNSGPSGNPKHLDYAQSIEDAGRHLNTLVTDLLDTAKIEAGKIEIAKAPVSSQMVIEQALRLVRGLAMEARVTLIMVPGEWPDVFVDSRTIKQVVVNLVSNAVKFSPQGATVNIESECGTDRLTIKVVDTGKGIAPEELKTLGRAYAQAGSAASRSKGTGLGLALSMQLVEQHGGQLRLQSIPNVGTTAIFDVARDL